MDFDKIKNLIDHGFDQITPAMAIRLFEDLGYHFMDLETELSANVIELLNAIETLPVLSKAVEGPMENNVVKVTARLPNKNLLMASTSNVELDALPVFSLFDEDGCVFAIQGPTVPIINSVHDYLTNN